MAMHEIDPTGDVILTLRTESSLQREELANQEPAQTPSHSNSRPAGGDYYRPAEPDRQTISDQSSSIAIALPNGRDINEDQVPSISSVQFRLSSKHLTLASSYFRCMFNGPWKEASLDEEAGYSVTADDWDEEALLIVMNIIHGQSRDVPRNIKLELLTKIAIIVDYYKCHQAIEPWCTNIWPRNTNFDVSQGYNKDSASRLFIAWVFSDANAFTMLTRNIVRQSREPLRSWSLALPEEIINKVAERREKILSDIISHLHQVHDNLRDREPTCSFECSSILLGALSRQMNEKRLLYPRPPPPYLGFSAVELTGSIRRLREPHWAVMNQNRNPGGGGYPSFEPAVGNSRCACKLSSLTMPRIHELMKGNLGLQLLDFPRSSNDEAVRKVSK